MLLLHMLPADSPPSPTANSSAQSDNSSASKGTTLVEGTLVCCTSATTTIAAAVESWPVLPSATAAALLHPVLQLLSRAVVDALHDISADESSSSDIEDAEEAQDRRRDLLDSYGRLLISVCLQSE